LDPGVYVIDCLPNLVAEEIRERAKPLVQTLRAARPATPIVLVEDRTLQDAFLLEGGLEHHVQSRAALRAAYESLLQEGVKQLHYIEGEHLLGDDGEGTVDASHPNDLGYMRQSEIFAQTLGPLLRAE